MFRSAAWGVAASLFIGLVVGLWAAVAKAPPEVAGGVASVLGAVFGATAFGGSLLFRLVTRARSTPAYARASAGLRR